jgi:peptide/nickel transport system substrate-binding protein
MTKRSRRWTPLLLAGALVVGCSGRDATDTGDTAAPTTTTATTGGDTTAPTGDSTAPTSTAPAEPGLSPTTPAATSEVDSVTWAVYRELNTLDPIYAFDYPENTILTTMCESLLQQQPDGTVEPGLATLTRPTDTSLVFDLREGVTFWDGAPLTADDVVFSLERQSDPALGGFYGASFTNVTSIDATSPTQVTLTLTKPDLLLEGELSSMAGIVIEKAYAESKGATYGTPDGGAMCTGPFQLTAWKTGDRVSVARNESYWNGTPKVAAIDFVGVPDEATLTAGLLSGDLDGSYIGPVSAFERLTSDPSVTVTEGPSFASAALIVSSLSGTLGDVAVRTALSNAIDREGLISAIYHGSAQLPRAIAGPGTWGYATDVFRAAYDALPVLTRDVEAGKAAIEAAGATGKKVTFATTNEIASIAAMANALKAAAEDIGLTVELKAVSAANYINLFIDPSAREGIDGFVTVNYPDFADPAALLSTFALVDGSQNYSGYENPEVTTLLEEARSTVDEAARADLVAQAQAIIQTDLPWIPLVHPNTVLVTSAGLTGAPSSFVYMNAPWAASLGGK